MYGSSIGGEVESSEQGFSVGSVDPNALPRKFRENQTMASLLEIIASLLVTNASLLVARS